MNLEEINELSKEELWHALVDDSVKLLQGYEIKLYKEAILKYQNYQMVNSDLLPILINIPRGEKVTKEKLIEIQKEMYEPYIHTPEINWMMDRIIQEEEAKEVENE